MRTLLLFLGLAACVAAGSSVNAAVSFTGDVSLPSSGNWTVGINEAGSLTIDGGSTLQSFDGLQIGGSSQGTVNVTGPGTLVSFNSPIEVGSSNQGFGNSIGIGRLNVLNGAELRTDSDLDLSEAGQLSFVTVGGVGSLLAVDDDYGPAIPGFSSTTVSDGGVLFVGRDFGPAGRVTVDGVGSTVLGGFGTFRVGEQFTASGGASVVLPNHTADVLPTGRLSIDDAALRFDTVLNAGLITGSGLIETRSINNNATGRIEARAGDDLAFTSDPNNSPFSLVNFGEVLVDGGLLSFDIPVVNNANGFDGTGTITLSSGELRAQPGNFGNPSFTNQSLFAATGGVSHVRGAVVNNSNGQIAVTNDSTLIFHDSVTNQSSGEISVMPGATAVFLGGLTNSQGGTLLANLAGTSDDTGFGTAEVVGLAQFLGATVDVASIGGFEPSLGDSFTLLTASSIVGEPTLGSVPALAPGLGWELNQTSNALTLGVVAALPGDVNGDLIVSAADYAVLRSSGGPTLGSDLDDWRASFGAAVAAQGPASVGAVPEPATFMMLVTAVLPCGRRRSR